MGLSLETGERKGLKHRGGRGFNLLDLIVDPCPKAALSLDEKGTVNGVSGDLKSFGYLGDELLGRPLEELLRGEDEIEDFTRFLEARARGATLRSKVRTRRGELVPVEMIYFDDKGRAGLAGPNVLLVKDLRSASPNLSGLNIRGAGEPSLGLLVSGICHEILNPLHIIYLSAQLLLSDREASGEDAGLVKSILEEVKRIEVVTDGLLTFAGEKQAVSSLLNVNKVVKETLDLIEHKLRLEGIMVTTRLDPGVPEIRGSSKQLGQAFFNFITNARDAMPKGGSLKVSTSYTSEGLIEVELKDTGMGIPADDMEWVFEPFFTTKPPGRGTGLGLCVAQSVLEDHQGTVRIESSEGAGTTVKIAIPANAAGQ